MAKLPTGDALGDRPTPQPAGGVAAYRGDFGALDEPAKATMRAGEMRSRTGSELVRTGGSLMAEGDQLFAQFKREHEKEKDKVDTLRAEDAINKLRQQQLNLTIGEKDGYVNLKGSQAINGQLLQTYTGRYDDAVKLISDSLANDDQRAKFRLRADAFGVQFQEGLLHHVVKERGVYEKETLAGTINTELANATAQWKSPEAVGIAIARIENQVRSASEQLGWPKEYAAAERIEALSKVHSAVISQAIASGDYQYAQKWYEANKPNIDKQTAVAVERAVEDGTQKQLASGYRSQYLTSQNSLPALRALNETVLKDPTLDDTRRNVQVGQIQNRIQVLEHKQEIASERALRKVERGIGQLNTMTLSGYEPTPAQFAPLIAASKGTELEGEVRQAVGLANATRSFRTQPPAAQERMLSEAESAVRKDPTKFDVRIIGAWRQIQEAQRTEIQKSPISFAVRQGLVDPPVPLDLSNPASAGPALEQRFGIARAMAGRYQAPMKPLTPEEATLLKSTLEKMPAVAKANYFSGLAQAAGSDYAGYSAIMGQIATDDPATAVAGQYAYRGRSDAANLILGGQAILNPPRKEDGKPDQGKLWPMPADKDFRDGFRTYERDAFAGHPGARNAMYQSALAIYAKKSVDVGDASGVIDNNRWNEAIKLATGGIEKYNGKATVLPYGYEYGQFKDGLTQRIDQVVAQGGLGDTVTRSKLLDMPLESVGDGRYVLKAGDGVLVNKDRQPVIIDFNQGTPFETSGGRGAAPAAAPRRGWKTGGAQ